MDLKDRADNRHELIVLCDAMFDFYYRESFAVTAPLERGSCFRFTVILLLSKAINSVDERQQEDDKQGMMAESLYFLVHKIRQNMER